MTFTLSGPLGPREVPAQVVLGKVDAAGGVEKEVKQTNTYGKYVMFANLEPGKYKVLRAVHNERSSTGPMAPVGGGFAVGISYSRTYTAEFEPEVAQRTLVEVPATAVAYLGDFSVTIRLKAGFSPKHEVGQPVRVLTEGSRHRAHEMLKVVDPVSPWVLVLKPPVFGVVVDELTDLLRVKVGSDKGLVVLAVGGNSPASAVGISDGAVVAQIGDKAIANLQSFDEALAQYAGKTATVKYFRYDGEQYQDARTVEVRFNERM
jgi:membrane-associated protease RseP (regulator of RpoE activity)